MGNKPNDEIRVLITVPSNHYYQRANILIPFIQNGGRSITNLPIRCEVSIVSDDMKDHSHGQRIHTNYVPHFTVAFSQRIKSCICSVDRIDIPIGGSYRTANFKFCLQTNLEHFSKLIKNEAGNELNDETQRRRMIQLNQAERNAMKQASNHDLFQNRYKFIPKSSITANHQVNNVQKSAKSSANVDQNRNKDATSIQDIEAQLTNKGAIDNNNKNKKGDDDDDDDNAWIKPESVLIEEIADGTFHAIKEIGNVPDPTQINYNMNGPLHDLPVHITPSGRRLLHMPHFDTAHSHIDHHDHQILHFVSVIAVFSIFFVIFVISAYIWKVFNKYSKKFN